MAVFYFRFTVNIILSYTIVNNIIGWKTMTNPAIPKESLVLLSFFVDFRMFHRNFLKPTVYHHLVVLSWSIRLFYFLTMNKLKRNVTHASQLYINAHDCKL